MMVLMMAAAAAAGTPVLPALPELKSAIAARDAEVFGVYFNGCDPARLRTMLTENMEFYHDKDGVVARDAAAFVADYDKSCREKLKPDAWRSRRELVASSLNVYPVPGFGAIEEGEHRFYERRGEGPEKLVGAARFTIIWALAPDGWRMSRVLSYGHRAIE